MTDLNKLEELAKAATPGPWSCWNPAEGESHITAGGRVTFYSLKSGSQYGDDEKIPHWADAAYIAAANPATVLELIGRINVSEALSQHEHAMRLVECERADNAEARIAKAAEALSWVDEGTVPEVREIAEDVRRALGLGEGEERMSEKRKPWGYIIINGNTAEMDWDSEIHDTVEQAIDSLCGPYQDYARSEADADAMGRVVWWLDYEIRPVLDETTRGSSDEAS